MILTLHRHFKCDKYTIGRLFINDKYFCDTLEDVVRNLPIEPKVYGKTAIPADVYEIKLTRSPHFKRVLPILIDVPYFTYIRMHAGCRAENTDGCILVGKNTSKGRLTQGGHYERELMKILEATNERIYIKIV